MNTKKILHLLVIPVLLLIFLVSPLSVYAAEESTDTGTYYVYPLSWQHNYYVDTNTGELVFRETSAVSTPYTLLVADAETYSVMKKAEHFAEGYVTYYDSDYTYLTYQHLFTAGPDYDDIKTTLNPPGNAVYFRVSLTCIGLDNTWMEQYCIGLFSMNYVKSDVENQPLQDALEENNRLQGVNNDLQSEANQLQAEANQQQQQMIDGYDNSAGDDVNDNFANKSDAFAAAEDSLFGMVNYDQVDYNQYNDFLGLPAVSQSAQFISSSLQSLFLALGDLGVPIMIGLVLLLFTRLIGLQVLAGKGK